MARPPRLERGTLCLEGRCSIQLSYGRTLERRTYLARIWIGGKLIRHGLKTKMFSHVKLHLEDLEKKWADCDFVKGKIGVRGDPVTGTKNSETRQVPMIPDMRRFLESLRGARGDD